MELLSSFIHQDCDDGDSRHVSASDKEGQQEISRRRNRHAFLERVHSYTSSRWFAKPIWMSPLECSRYGWENVDVDILRCVSCKIHISGRMPASSNPTSYEECCRQLKESLHSGHRLTCSWLSSPSPEYFLRLPHDTRPKAGRAFSESLERLVKLGEQLPLIAESTLNTMGMSLIQLQQVLGMNSHLCQEVSQPEVQSAAVMALTGWTTSDSAGCIAMVHCAMCNRDIGMWNFLTLANPVDHVSEDEAKEHGQGAMNKNTQDIDNTTEKSNQNVETPMEGLEPSIQPSADELCPSTQPSAEEPDHSTLSSAEWSDPSTQPSIEGSSPSTQPSAEVPDLYTQTPVDGPGLSSETSAGGLEPSTEPSAKGPNIATNTSAERSDFSTQPSAGESYPSIETSAKVPDSTTESSVDMPVDTQTPAGGQEVPTQPSAEGPDLSIQLSAVKLDLSTQSSTEELDGSTLPSADELDRSAQPSAEGPDLSTEPSAEVPDLSTEPPAEEPDLSTGPSAEGPDPSTKPSAQQPDLSTEPSVEEAKISTQSSSDVPDLSTETSAEGPDLSTQTFAERPDLSTQPCAKRPDLSTQPSVEGAEISTQPSAEGQDLPTSSSVKGLDPFSEPTAEGPDPSTQPSAERPDISTQISAKELDISTQPSAEELDISTQPSAEEQDPSTDMITESSAADQVPLTPTVQDIGISTRAEQTQCIELCTEKDGGLQSAEENINTQGNSACEDTSRAETKLSTGTHATEAAIETDRVCEGSIHVERSVQQGDHPGHVEGMETEQCGEVDSSTSPQVVDSERNNVGGVVGNTSNSGGQDEKAEEAAENDQTEGQGSDEPPMKRQKRTAEPSSVRKKHRRQKTMFQPLSEHHAWCPWVATEGDQPGWQQVLYLLMPQLSPNKNTHMPNRANMSSPDVIRGVRRLLKEWTSPTAFTDDIIS